MTGAEREERNRQIVERIKAGEPTKAVARKFKMTSINIRTICRKAGLRKYRKRRDRGIKKARNAEIVERIKAGEILEDVAKEFELSLNTVKETCRKAGVRTQTLQGRERQSRNAEIVHRIQTGETQRAVAREFGMSPAGVTRICKLAGVNRQDMIQERNAEIVRRVKEGGTYEDVASEFGLATGTVNSICLRAGVSSHAIRAERIREELHARNTEIVRRVKAGETPTAVGKDFGLTNNQVTYICRRAGFRQRQRIDDKDQRQRRDAEIVCRIKAGEIQIAVAEAFGMTPQHVGLICREAGVNLRVIKQEETQARNAEIVRRIKAGGSRTAVAAEFGLVRGTVSRICRKAGVSVLALKQEERQIRNADIVRRIKAGETIEDVAKEFGISKGSVSLICRQVRKKAQTDQSLCSGSAAEEDA